jgi:hypothetical protein
LQDFSKATRPVSFFLYVEAFVEEEEEDDDDEEEEEDDDEEEEEDENVEWQNVCLDNAQNERLVVKTIDPLPRNPRHFGVDKLVLVSRYPVAANQGLIEANEQEIMKWNFDEQKRQIRLDHSLVGQNGNNV